MILQLQHMNTSMNIHTTSFSVFRNSLIYILGKVDFPLGSWWTTQSTFNYLEYVIKLIFFLTYL